MELIARAPGRVERVTVERESGRYRVRVGERFYEVEARALGSFVRSLLVDGRSYEVAVFRQGEGAWSVSHRGRPTAVEMLDPLAHLAEATRGEGARKGRQVVTAYMPGRVVVVSVAEGDAVEAGAPLVVLEAMKMQNEIQAERAAVVRRVCVVPGQAVEGGDPLVELE
ncbi:MAG: biotin/lipoyl-binding protein [Thermoanaerobaculia bacterium]|nr:MAG: biotin/lipoyl-binding protein [Thermoanaerobaculia bacterium]